MALNFPSARLVVIIPIIPCLFITYSFMADALISLVLERLTSVAEQQIRDELNLVLGVDAEIQSLKDGLRSIRDVIEDAERRQVKEKSVQGWLEKLKDMAYQMDDVVDEWSTAILRLQIEGTEDHIASTSKKKKVCYWAPSPFSCLKQLASRRDIALKIKRIKKQLDIIDRDGNRFQFVPTRIEQPLHPITTSRVDFSEVCGREIDRKIIIGHLLDEKNERGPGVYIISIVGAGGMGKTTLAQLAYNHPEVRAHFDERIWVCVSDPFEPARIFRHIYEVLQKEPPKLDSLEALQEKVETLVSGRKFLLVLDDVWTGDYRSWEQVKNSLACGAIRSRILLTTRKESVVQMTRSSYRHQLGGLSKEQSRALFHQIAFSEKCWEKDEELKEIGDKIADRCRGLPLAIKTLGNLMRSKNDMEDWEAVLNNKVWQEEVFERDISPALLLSYYDLPPAIKRCFSFCAVLPKDHLIRRDELIRLWMAHNFLYCNASKEMEMVGKEYFEYLAAASLFQDFVRDDEGNIIQCKMHDIVHDFAQFLTKNECFVMESDKQGQRSIDNSRHASLIKQKGVEEILYSSSMKNLHTLLLSYQFFSEGILPSFQNLTCLRALKLGKYCSLEKLPEEIGKLIHLRYLDLQGWWTLIELPEMICNLYNLQTLNIAECHQMKKLPQAMGKLINLRHLDNSHIHCLESLPKGVGRLRSLQTLKRFIISSDGDEQCQLRDLRNLNQVRALGIEGLDRVEDACEAEEAGLEKKIHLQHLELSFGKKGIKDVAEALKPPPKLRSLSINDYEDVMLPSWTTSSSLSHLKRLRLWNLMECSCLPPLGELPALECLQILGMPRVIYMGDELLGSSSNIAFPKLKTLAMANLSNWEKWEAKEEDERTIMPTLDNLEISFCPKLITLPDHLLQRIPRLQKLEIKDCDVLKQHYEKDGRISQNPNARFLWHRHTTRRKTVEELLMQRYVDNY